MCFISKENFALLKKGDILNDGLSYEWKVVTENQKPAVELPEVTFNFNNQSDHLLTHDGERILFAGGEGIVRNFLNDLLCSYTKAD